MLRKTFLPAIFILLAYGFVVSEDFKTITAGVAIFLFGANLGTTTGAWLVAGFGLKVLKELKEERNQSG
jgi:Na+/phosphate symporter